MKKPNMTLNQLKERVRGSKNGFKRGYDSGYQSALKDVLRVMSKKEDLNYIEKDVEFLEEGISRKHDYELYRRVGANNTIDTITKAIEGLKVK